MHLDIREFIPSDLDELQHIRALAFAPVFSSFRSIVGREIADTALASAEAEQEQLLARLCAPDSPEQVYVAVLDGQIVGFAALSLDKSARVGEISLNAVHPDFSGRGIGTRLYRSLIEVMKAEGMKVASVGTGGDPSHAPARRAYEKAGFWTRHFDGIYVFHDEDDQVVVVGDPTKVEVDEARRPQDRFIAMSDLKAVLDYLTNTGRVEPLNLEWLSRSGIVGLRFAIYCRLQMSLQNKKLDPSAITDVEVDNWVHKNLSRLKKSKVFRQLHDLQRVVLNGSRPDTDGFDAEMMLMSLRANPGHDDWLLVNRFLSEFVPYDFLTRFIVNKQAFYRDYETFSDAHREYAVRLITATYFPDKQELWSALFEQWRLSDA